MGMQFCSQCGFPFDPSKIPICPKCQSSGDREGLRQVLEVDVAHDGESWEVAREKILRALDQAISGQHKGLRIIHGYGSMGGEAVISPRAISLMRHLAEQNDARFSKDSKNPGVSIIWLNRGRSRNAQVLEDQHYYKRSLDNREPLGGNWFDQALKKKH